MTITLKWNDTSVLDLFYPPQTDSVEVLALDRSKQK